MSHETGRAAGIAGDIPAPKRLCAREQETSCLLWHPLASYIQRHGQRGHYTWHITAIPGEMLELAPCNGILFFLAWMPNQNAGLRSRGTDPWDSLAT